MKPLTVRQMKNRFQKLIDEGHGSAIVLRGDLNPANSHLEPFVYKYIGPSQWDDRTYARTDEEGRTVIV